MLYPCLQYCTRADILELIPMDKRIDFNIIGRDGGNIFYQCLMPAIQIIRRDEFRATKIPSFRSGEATSIQDTFFETFKKMKLAQSILVPAIEDRFFKLVEAGQKHGYDTDVILETPNVLGSTVFEAASLFSVKICTYILNRNIRVNNILTNFVYPVFHPTSEAIWEKMLKKGINPKVITGRVLTHQVQKFTFLFRKK